MTDHATLHIQLEDNSIAYFNNGMEFSPGNFYDNQVLHVVPAWHAIGINFSDLSRLITWDEMIVENGKALVIDPDLSNAHSNLGAALQMKGDLDGAIAQYRRALVTNPQNDIVRTNLDNALIKKEINERGYLSWSIRLIQMVFK